MATADVPPPPVLQQAPPIAGSSWNHHSTRRNLRNNNNDTTRNTIAARAAALSRRQTPSSHAGSHNNIAATASGENYPPMSNGQFQVKSFMAALGTQENTNHIPRNMAPGAIPVHGVNSTAFLDTSLDNVGDPSEREDEEDNDCLPLAAQLAPDEAEVTARLAERLERQLTETIQERVKEQMQVQQQQQHQEQYLRQTTSSAHSYDHPPAPPVLAEAVASSTIDGTLSSSKASSSFDDNFKICGLRRRTWGVMLVIFLVVAAGAVAGVMIFLKGSENDDNESLPTSMPSLAPSTNPRVVDVREEILSIIAPNETTDREAFNNPSSPQSVALNWIETDPISLSIGRPTQRVVERYALAVFYFATNGPTWTQRNFGYLSSAEVCQWNNRLDPMVDDEAFGVYCGLNSRVSHILLRDNGLQGVIPWEISLLASLEVIDLDENSLRGTIPPRVSDLTQLHIFWANSNFLTGPLPNSLGEGMQSLDLTSNELTGALPASWADTMPLLFFIGLGFNQLDGSLPSDWVNLDLLERVDLASNALTGSIPNYGPFWRDMKSLFLEENLLVGRLPASLAQMVDLQDLVVYDNQLTGSIPSTLGELTALTYLSLAANDFEGSLDTTLCLTLPIETQVDADCLADESSNEIQVECSCCSICCSDEGGFCEEYN